jgi:hypothetical protein
VAPSSLPLTGELTAEEQREHLVVRVKAKAGQLHDAMVAAELRAALSDAAETFATPETADAIRAGHTGVLGTWRALLSGEKSATQDLGLADYAYAARQAFHHG